ncbi:MAG TPA: TlpA disulfide reductase family protein [Terriglobales bacterium]|nr:TlpA disulfide reductase family protein [Terriglobales bacterium]
MKTAVLALLLAVAAQAQSPISGLWVGTAQRNGHSTPLSLDLTQSGAEVQARFHNGPQSSVAYSGTFADDRLQLSFDDFANQLTATLSGEVLTGTFGGHARPAAVRLVHVPDISGEWEIPVQGPKGESEWRLEVSQSGVEVSAVIQRIDGDTGALYGAFNDADAAFHLSHFTADGPRDLVLRPLPGGALQVGPRAAHRPIAADSASADDPLRHTVMSDPAQPLRFAFPDLHGKLVSSTDARFHGKVVIVTVGGSWCPNCHDEAPFLESLYRKYHARGLEIVDLSFEEASELANPVRLRAFIRRSGITFPVLLAGTPDQLAAKLPQVANLNCWPTTFYIGRDGLVKQIHAGFSGPATGPLHAALLTESDALVRRLLAR